MAVFISAVCGCNAVNNRTIEPIKATLSEKYGKSFTVAALSDRTDKSGEIVHEEYSYRLLCRNVENEIKKAFEKYKIKSECYVTFTPRKNINASPDMTFDEFVKVNSLKKMPLTSSEIDLELGAAE